MRIERLGEENLADVYCCLSDRKELYRDEIDHSVRWLRKKLRLGWLAYALYDDSGRPVGTAQVSRNLAVGTSRRSSGLDNSEQRGFST